MEDVKKKSEEHIKGCTEGEKMSSVQDIPDRTVLTTIAEEITETPTPTLGREVMEAGVWYGMVHSEERT